MNLRILQEHEVELDAKYAVYYAANKTGTGATRLTQWRRFWGDPQAKIGFGLSAFGDGVFGFGGKRGRLNYDNDYGFGYSDGYIGTGFGTSHFGYWENTILIDLDDYITTDGRYSFLVRLKDAAGNISSDITDVETTHLCNIPATPTSAKFTSSTGQSITFSWRAG